MSGFDYATITQNTNVDDIIGELDTKWRTLDTTIGTIKTNALDCDSGDKMGDGCKISQTNLDTLSEKKDDFVSEFKKYMSRVDGSEEFKKHHNNLYDIASMKPIHLSVGVMILSVLIYELYSN